MTEARRFLMRTRGRVTVVIAIALIAFLLWPEDPPGPTGGWMEGAGVQPRFETVEGLRLRYVRAGSGSPILLLHGFASSVFTWKEVLPLLARRHDVVAVDLPGFGQSDQPTDLTFALYPRIVAAFMNRLGIPRATLVGNSMGGGIAVAMAVGEPARVERLVLIDAAGFLAPKDSPWILKLAASRPLGIVLDRLPVRRRLVRAALGQVFYDQERVTADRVEEYLFPLMRPGATAAMRSLLASRAALGAELIATVRVPTLVLWGRQDKWIPVENAARFAAAIPDSQEVVLEKCGHLPQEERPQDVAALIEGFQSYSAGASGLPR